MASESGVVVFADRFYMAESDLAELSRLGGYLWADAVDALDLGKKLEALNSARVVVSEYVPINASVLERARQLKGIIAYGAGYDHIEVAAAVSRGILVCNCRGENSQAVAELAFGLLLSLLRRIRETGDWIRKDGWTQGGRALPSWIMGRELQGKTLGIVGLGQIGSRVARIAAGFGMKILACDPVARPSSDSDVVPLEALVARADIITLHVPLTGATENLIDSRCIAAMKPGSVIVNTSRGRVIEEPALVEALKTGRIAGAALDVFADEPIGSDHPLAKMENVVLTPHMGAMTAEAGDRLSRSVARQARDILAGRKPEGLIPQPT